MEKCLGGSCLGVDCNLEVRTCDGAVFYCNCIIVNTFYGRPSNFCKFV